MAEVFARKRVQPDCYHPRSLNFLVKRLVNILENMGDEKKNRFLINEVAKILLVDSNNDLLKTHPILYRDAVKKIEECAKIADKFPEEDLEMTKFYCEIFPKSW